MSTIHRWRESIRNAFTNWQQAMPLRRKVWLLLRNNLIKASKRQSCCGHTGDISAADIP